MKKPALFSVIVFVALTSSTALPGGQLGKQVRSGTAEAKAYKFPSIRQLDLGGKAGAVEVYVEPPVGLRDFQSKYSRWGRYHEWFPHFHYHHPLSNYSATIHYLGNFGISEPVLLRTVHNELIRAFQQSPDFAVRIEPSPSAYVVVSTVEFEQTNRQEEFDGRTLAWHLAQYRYRLPFRYRGGPAGNALDSTIALLYTAHREKLTTDLDILVDFALVKDGTFVTATTGQSSLHLEVYKGSSVLGSSSTTYRRITSLRSVVREAIQNGLDLWR